MNVFSMETCSIGRNVRVMKEKNVDGTFWTEKAQIMFCSTLSLFIVIS